MLFVLISPHEDILIILALSSGNTTANIVIVYKLLDERLFKFDIPNEEKKPNK